MSRHTWKRVCGRKALTGGGLFVTIGSLQINFMNKNLTSIFRVLGMGLLGYILALIGSTGAPPELARELTKWTVLLCIAIAVIWDVSEFSYENGYKDGKNS